MDQSINMSAPNIVRVYARPEFGFFSRIIEALFVLAFMTVTVVSLIPTETPSSAGHFDKVMHLVSYFVLTMLTLFAVRSPRLTVVFLAVSLYGALIEIAQGQIGTGRSPSLGDFLANLIGAGLAIFAYMMWTHFRNPKL